MSASQIVRRVISTAKAPKAIGPYSQAVLVDKTLYVSGQLGLNPESNTFKRFYGRHTDLVGQYANNQTMNFVSEDVQEQTKQALSNMGQILEAAGSGFEKVVKTTVLLADINDFVKVNEIYSTYCCIMCNLTAICDVGQETFCTPVFSDWEKLATRLLIRKQELVVFKQPFPARAAYQVANLPKLGKVEIEAIAVVGEVKDE